MEQKEDLEISYNIKNSRYMQYVAHRRRGKIFNGSFA